MKGKSPGDESGPGTNLTASADAAGSWRTLRGRCCWQLSPAGAIKFSFAVKDDARGSCRQDRQRQTVGKNYDDKLLGLTRPLFVGCLLAGVCEVMEKSTPAPCAVRKASTRRAE